MTERLEAAEIRILTVDGIARGHADLTLAVVRRVDVHVHDVLARAPVEEHFQSLDYASASRTSLLLLVVSFAILTFTYAMQRSVWIKPRL